jgi:hypothetical protein
MKSITDFSEIAQLPSDDTEYTGMWRNALPCQWELPNRAVGTRCLQSNNTNGSVKGIGVFQRLFGQNPNAWDEYTPQSVF